MQQDSRPDAVDGQPALPQPVIAQPQALDNADVINRAAQSPDIGQLSADVEHREQEEDEGAGDAAAAIDRDAINAPVMPDGDAMDGAVKQLQQSQEDRFAGNA